MNRTKTSYRNKPFSFPKIVITGFLFFGLLLFANLALAQSSSRNSGQWKSVGGKMVASGKGNFTNTWSAATRYWHGDGKYWKNDEPPSNKAGKIPATHTQEEVDEDIWINKGQIIVRGPGFLGLYMKSKGAGAFLKYPESNKKISGEVFRAHGLGKDEWLTPPGGKGKWYSGDEVDVDPTNSNATGGWVPAGQTITLDVWVHNPWSEWGVWGNGYSAPKSVYYKFWFFPREGGKIIKTALMNHFPKIVKHYETDDILIYSCEGEEVEVDLNGTGEFEAVTKDKLPIKMGANGKVITGFGSSAKIVIVNRGIVNVKELTNYAIGEFLITDEGITAHTNMKMGEVNYKHVSGDTGPAIDFSVSSPAVTSSVRGTEFTISHKESPMKSTVIVYSGKVEVTPKLCSEPARILTAGQRITVDENCFGALEVFDPKDTDKPGTSGSITNTGTQPPQTGSNVTGSGGSIAQGTARLLTASSDRDMVGRNEGFRGNGKTDAIFRARFSALNRTVTAVEVSNTNGLRSVWDTRPNNRLWLGGVVIEGRTMNHSDGSVNFGLGSGQTTLDFFVEDNGSIRGGKTNYRMTIFFASGEPLVMNIIPGGGGTPGGIRIESATYGGNCGVAKGNVTAHVARQCNGKSKCRYVVNHKIIGDPAFGCAKTYSVQYQCNNNPRVFEKTLAAEAGLGDKSVLLQCAD